MGFENEKFDKCDNLIQRRPLNTRRLIIEYLPTDKCYGTSENYSKDWEEEMNYQGLFGITKGATSKTYSH